jgi:hypothetical protein
MIEDSRDSRAGEDVDILDKIKMTKETLGTWPGIKEHPCRSCGNRCGCGCSPERCSLCPPCSEEGSRIRAEILVEEEGIFPDPDSDASVPGDDEDEFPDDDELEEDLP